MNDKKRKNQEGKTNIGKKLKQPFKEESERDNESCSKKNAISD